MAEKIQYCDPNGAVIGAWQLNPQNLPLHRCLIVSFTSLFFWVRSGVPKESFWGLDAATFLTDQMCFLLPNQKWCKALMS